jgi:hypothetical protein
VRGGCGSAELAGGARVGEGTATLPSMTLCAFYYAIFPCQQSGQKSIASDQPIKLKTNGV